MNRKYLICRKICGVAFVALTSIFFHSCADAYTDKETFVSSVQNQVLQSPLSDSIKLTIVILKIDFEDFDFSNSLFSQVPQKTCFSLN